MASLDDDTKRHFMARRYMDDILLLMRKGGWDSQRFYEDFRRSECYAERAEAAEPVSGPARLSHGDAEILIQV